MGPRGYEQDQLRPECTGDRSDDMLGPSLCPTPEDGSPLVLVDLVLETAAVLRRALTPGLECALGVGGQSFDILIRLVRSADGRLRMNELAAQTGMTPSGLTRAVDRLVEAGMVERTTCPSDRRVSFAHLTEVGKRRTTEALARHGREIAEMMDGVLTARDEAALVALLRTLRERVRPGIAPGNGGAPSR